jgi:hypothetical protein
MNKTRSPLLIFFKKNKLTHYYFKSSPFIYSSWIDCMDFFIFWPSKICVSPTGVVSSIFPFQCRLSSGQRRLTTAPYHASFPWSQDELTASASYSGNASSHRLPSRAETEALICTSATGHPPWTARLPPVTAIKKSSQPWSLSPSLHHVSNLLLP